MQRTIRFLGEARPGNTWRARARKMLPGYLAWFEREGLRKRPRYIECERALAGHMPELAPVWRELVELVGGGNEVARLLSLWRPTPFLVGCSQVAWPHEGPSLLRNYDYAPWLWEGDFWHTAWRDTPVLAASDCLWGVLDGMNASGLVVSLSFGGSREVGEGFGMPLILRYVLETCVDVASGVAVLLRVPSHMAYNVTLVDAAGTFSTVQVAAGGGARVLAQERVAVNHQQDSNWGEYARKTHSFERERAVRDLLDGPALAPERVAERFLESPLWNGSFSKGYGTLYTALWEPRHGALTVLWRSGRVRQSVEAFTPQQVKVSFRDAPLESPLAP